MSSSIYIFRPEDHSDKELFEIVRDRERLQKDGFIGDCLMRRIAQKQKSSFGALEMEKVAARAAFEIIRRKFPFGFVLDTQKPSSPVAIEAAMQKMPYTWRMRWCEANEAGLCACMGCANVSGRLRQLGFTKEQWTAWKNSLPEKEVDGREKEKYFGEDSGWEYP